jgi:2-amino-4-hydroxy-6-hydroxymethyldihydropteridine diphosphokinase
MIHAYVGLGSNLDDPRRQVDLAITMLGASADTEVEARSSLYLSAPFGPVEQPDFVNAVVKLATALGARELLTRMQEIERRLGREPAGRWGPRIIDLDLLVYGDLVIDEVGLNLPHPGIAERNFVLLPLSEIAPELLIPGLGRLADIAVNESEPQISRIA